MRAPWIGAVVLLALVAGCASPPSAPIESSTASTPPQAISVAIKASPFSATATKLRLPVINAEESNVTLHLPADSRLGRNPIGQQSLQRPLEMKWANGTVTYGFNATSLEFEAAHSDGFFRFPYLTHFGFHQMAAFALLPFAGETITSVPRQATFFGLDFQMFAERPNVAVLEVPYSTPSDKGLMRYRFFLLDGFAVPEKLELESTSSESGRNETIQLWSIRIQEVGGEEFPVSGKTSVWRPALRDAKPFLSWPPDSTVHPHAWPIDSIVSYIRWCVPAPTLCDAKVKEFVTGRDFVVTGAVYQPIEEGVPFDERWTLRLWEPDVAGLEFTIQRRLTSGGTANVTQISDVRELALPSDPTAGRGLLALGLGEATYRCSLLPGYEAGALRFALNAPVSPLAVGGRTDPPLAALACGTFAHFDFFSGLLTALKS